jgi:hypothetical protein
MNRRLAASIVLATAFVAVASWALGQRARRLPDSWESGQPHEPYLIDDVDASRRVPVRQTGNEGQTRPGRVRAVPPIEGGPVYLIDDVDPARRVPVRQTEGEGQTRPGRGRALPPIERGPAARYAVAASEKSMVLVDATTGSTWILCPARSGHPADAVWLPIRRIDDKDEAALWKAHQEELKKKATKGAERNRR